MVVTKDKVYGRFLDSITRDITTLGGTPLYFGLIVLLLLLGYLENFLLLLIGYVLTLGINVLIRVFYFKDRPKKISYSTFIGKMDASSFPSVHTSRAFFLAPLFAIMFGFVSTWILMYALAVLVAWSRIRLKKHDIWDVLAGIVVGTVSFVLLWLLF